MKRTVAKLEDAKGNCPMDKRGIMSIIRQVVLIRVETVVYPHGLTGRSRFFSDDVFVLDFWWVSLEV